MKQIAQRNHRNRGSPMNAKQAVFHVLALCLAVPGILPAQTPSNKTADWPQFLGPTRNGISPETGLLNEWPVAGPKEVWRTKGGVGQAGIAVSRGRLFTLVQNDGQQQLIALD